MQYTLFHFTRKVNEEYIIVKIDMVAIHPICSKTELRISEI